MQGSRMISKNDMILRQYFINIDSCFLRLLFDFTKDISTKEVTERHPERKRRISYLSQNLKVKTQKLIGFDL